jgi:hypothetical protein
MLHTTTFLFWITPLHGDQPLIDTSPQPLRASSSAALTSLILFEFIMPLLFRDSSASHVLLLELKSVALGLKAQYSHQLALRWRTNGFLNGMVGRAILFSHSLLLLRLMRLIHTPKCAGGFLSPVLFRSALFFIALLCLLRYVFLQLMDFLELRAPYLRVPSIIASFVDCWDGYIA